MRADRLLAILLLLQAHRQLTAGELARRLEVSDRTIHRDMEALCAAGVPVYAERGQGGGWFLAEEYRMQLPSLSAGELQALALIKPRRLLDDLGLRQAAESALAKLLAALPAAARGAAAAAWERLYVDLSGWSRSAEPIPHLRTVQAAVGLGRRLRLGYRRADGATVERLVDPLGLVAKGNIWYLVAAAEGEPRTYRVSRIEAAELTDESAARPAEFDLAAYWERAAAEFRAQLPRYPLILRADPAIVPRLRYAGWYSRVEEVGPPEEDGWVRVAMSFELAEDACSLVLGFGAALTIVEPAELREAVVGLARAALSHHGAD
ncbi:MAG TPA: WYL domain-containing protein [Herpetosiphonaceae bacterium]